MTIEKRIERIEAILDARGLDWDHPRVEEKPAKEPSLDRLPDIRTFAQPNLRWRILEPGELIKQGDWSCRKSLPSCNDPVKGNGWLMTGAWGLLVREEDACVYARPVADEPAKEPPKKWRILEPGEVVCSSDWICARSNLPSDPPNGLGWRPVDASVGTSVCEDDPCIFARPVADEPAKEPEHPASEKPPEPEYREPVLPADAGKRCEFSISGKTWDTLELVGWNDDPEGWPWKSRLSNNDITCWEQCRIKKDA